MKKVTERKLSQFGNSIFPNQTRAMYFPWKLLGILHHQEVVKFGHKTSDLQKAPPVSFRKIDVSIAEKIYEVVEKTGFR